MGETPPPRYAPDQGKYVWESAPEPVAPVEPAFVREAISALNESAPAVTVRAPSGVVTFADVYPRGTRDHATTDAPLYEEADPLVEWRVAADVADDILISLPDSTPRMVRQFLTLLMGAMRR